MTKKKPLRQPPPGTAAEMRHELAVHQMELEMQNETLRQSQVALEHSRDRYADLYDFAPVGYLALSDRGLIAEINLTGAALLGLDRSSLISRSFAKFVAAEDSKRWQQLLLHALQHQERHADELLLRRADGSMFAALIVGQRKAADSVLLSLTDISERKAIEVRLIASEQRYRALFRDAADAVAIAAADGRLEEVNARFAALLGYDKDELRGVSIERIHPAGELPRIRRHFAAIFTSGSVAPLETLVLCKDGSRVEVEIRPTLIELGDHAVAQGVFIDLTERRRQEQQRIEQERLQRKLLVREIHHRIKNNLQSVAGLLQRELGRFIELDPRLEIAISQVHAIAVVHGLQGADPDETIRLCDSIGNICKMVGELSMRPVNFCIENEHTTFRPVQIASDDAVSVALVLNELILNAVKHSAPGGIAPTVSLTADGSSAEIVIRNSVQGKRGPDIDIDVGRGLGAGLRLVRSLLPEQGAHVAHESDREHVMLTRLTLAAPVIAAWDQQRQDPGCA